MTLLAELRISAVGFEPTTLSIAGGSIRSNSHLRHCEKGYMGNESLCGGLFVRSTRVLRHHEICLILRSCVDQINQSLDAVLQLFES